MPAGSYPDTVCYLIELTDQVRRSLRRYVGTEKAKCSGPYGYHNASTPFDEVDRKVVPAYRSEGEPPRDDLRWPVKCEHCDYFFTPGDPFQLFTAEVWRRTDNGERMTIDTASPGAMWNAYWLVKYGHCVGPDGRALCVKLPNGRIWEIDGRCNNCTLPEDKVHRCWVRHGEAPKLTVDKNGNTCAAGGGSIQANDYHGFLTDGVLKECR